MRKILKFINNNRRLIQHVIFALVTVYHFFHIFEKERLMHHVANVAAFSHTPDQWAGQSDSLSPPDTMPRNINIVLLGDSVMRFAYISLAYFLHTGEWLHPSATQQPCNLVEAWSCPGNDPGVRWKQYNQLVVDLLGEHHFCDCFRGQFDARYFYDPVRNNRVSFFMRGGHHKRDSPFRGRVDSSVVWHNFTQRAGLPFGHQASRHSWEYYDWDEMIIKQVGRMDPKPDAIILNAGLWVNRFYIGEVREAVLLAAKTIGVNNVLWRTTTYQLRNKEFSNETLLPQGQAETDRRACNTFTGCINVSFTGDLHRDFFSDHRHFREPVNRAMNEAMLQALGYLPNGYKQLDISLLSQPYDEAIFNSTISYRSCKPESRLNRTNPSTKN